MLGFGDSSIESMRGTFQDIMSTSVPDDGVIFDLDSVRAEPIRAERVYGGVRIKAFSFIGTARTRIQIDVGFGDAVTPGPGGA